MTTTAMTHAPATGGRVARTARRVALDAVIALTSFAAVILIWFLVTEVFHLVPAFKLPSPVAVWKDGVALAATGELQSAILSSLGRMTLGLVTGAGLGITLGLLLGVSTPLLNFFSPLVTFFQAIAGPVWIPLAVLWFGLSTASVGFIVFNTVFFLVFYGTLMGVRTTDRILVDAVATLGGGRWARLRDVVIPGAAGGIIYGLSGGIGYGWRTLIAAEIIASGTGLGVLIWDGQRMFQVANIFVGLLLIGAISIAMKSIVVGSLSARTVQLWGTERR